MARVTYGSGVTEFKGSVGGVTFQRNTSGPIIKHKTYFPNSPSEAQAIYQRNLAYLVSKWSTLTSTQRAAWDTYAAAHDHTNPWGEVRTISGYQWWLSQSLDQLIFGYSYPTTPQTWGTPSPCDQFTLSASSSYLKLLWSPSYEFLNGTNLMYVSPPLKQGNLNIRRNLFTLQTIGSSTYSEIDITSAFESYFNVTWSTFYASAKCFIIVRIRIIDETYLTSSAFTSALLQLS